MKEEVKVLKFNAPELMELEKSKAEQIRATFEPMSEMLESFELAYNEIVTASNEEITQELPPNSIVYCDPPYEGTTKYANDFDHNLFWNWVRNISKQGHTVFVSEYNAPADFECVWQKEAKSSLSANGKIGGNKVSVEKLFKFSPTNVN